MIRRCVVITGAESGIGAACAVAFGASGDAVAVFYLDDLDAAEASAAAVRNAGGKAITVRCSVDNEASVGAAFDAVERQFGKATVLVNSAGLNMSGVTVRAMSLAQWHRLIETDLTGAFLVSRRFLKGRAEDGQPASITHISSIHAHAVRSGAADYCAAKAGLCKLVETLAIEEAPNGVRVNSIEPGMILTQMNDRASRDPVYRSQLEQHIPMGRAGKADEVAALARWLASDEAAYITGARVVIDGGLSLVQAPGA